MDLNLKSKITLHQEGNILKNDLCDIKIWKCFWSMPWKWKWSHSVAQLYLTLCDHGLFTPWTVAYQASPSMGFSRQEYWSGLAFPSPGNLPDSGIEPGSPALQTDALPSEPPGKPKFKKPLWNITYFITPFYMHCWEQTIYKKQKENEYLPRAGKGVGEGLWLLIGTGFYSEGEAK